MPPAAHLPASDLLQRIPLSAQVILDVGCGTGDLGAAFKRLNPKARFLGIEQNPEAAAVAADCLDEVAILDVDSTQLPFDLPNGLDCIIYSAALAHMRDPWHVVREHAKSLNADGVILICVPNIEHWSFTERVLRGTWDYEPSGLLDRGHLRWFSVESTRRGLSDAGLYLCDLQPRVFDSERARQFANALAPGLEALGIDAEGYARRASALQYIWRARKEPPRRLNLAGNMMSPVGGVSHVRVVHPFQAMATDPDVSVSLSNTISRPSGNDDIPRIFILHRPALSGRQGLDMLRALMDAGWLVVTEFDDHPDFFQAMQSDAQLSFRGVHAVQTSTPALAETLRGRNPEIAIFPNAIVSLPEVRNFREPGEMTFFFGALNREQDWRPFMAAINAVAEIAGARLKFRIVHDEAFFTALRTPHKTFTSICDYETYNALLGECEISFMPLADNGFNRAKSDLKFIEAAAHRVVPLASTVVYGDSIVDEHTGLLFRDPDRLRTLLMRLLVMPEWGRAIADRARDYVASERMLAYQVAPRIAWYRSLWARREDLTAAMWARLANEL